MKAIRIHRFGGPEVLVIDDLPDPEPAEGELLVRVLASGVNPVDHKIRDGDFFGPERLPFAMGRDVAGLVEQVAPGLDAFAPGDPIYAMLPMDRGGHAELVAVPAGACARWAGCLDPIAAASVPLAGLTAWQGLFDHGGLQAGQHVLIHGAAGGVGHLAVQFARAKGARVSATAGADDIDFVRKLGAEQVVDYRAERFEDAVRDVDLVLDLVAGETQDRSWSVLKRGGVLVSTLAPPSDDKAARHGARGLNFMAQPSVVQLGEIASLVDAGEVTPHVDRVLPFGAVAEAQRHLAEEHVRGKVVLQILDEV